MGIIDIRPGASEYGYAAPARISCKAENFKDDCSFVDLHIDQVDTGSSEMPRPQARLKNKASFSERLSLLIAWRWHRSWMLLVPMGALLALYVFLIFFSLDQVADGAKRSSWKHNASHSQLRIEMRVTGVDLLANRIQSRIYFFPSTSLAPTWASINAPISVYFKYKHATFAANSTMDPIDASFPILSGSNYYYPFDSFHSSISVAAMNIETRELIPIDVSLEIHTPSLWVDILRDNATDPYLDQMDIVKAAKANHMDLSQCVYRLNLLLTRPDFIVFFCIFVVLVMWAITWCTVGITAYVTLLNPDRPPTAYLALGPSLLFAIPILRAIQPDVPPIGAFIDVLGFFW
ncbi:hypothetical protein DSO57_1026407 [Entomophthora muscae]|uniref:Uncharacterized protein n=1 Tax=Entomophthora muscae TaxID=34485 RepID=A0ACC2UBJ6_9FUNG|nr:hypothetical protein DSO57_1026407 [Entomophthora muscae]